MKTEYTENGFFSETRLSPLELEYAYNEVKYSAIALTPSEFYSKLDFEIKRRIIANKLKGKT